MREIVSSKFEDPVLTAELMATGPALLIEGNTHHDQTWGDCTCPTHAEFPGKNHLGGTLMRLRSELRGDPPKTWPRIGITGHRDLTAEQDTWLSDEMRRVMGKLRSQNGSGAVISGMAIGADVLAAEAAVDIGLPLWAYLPFADQVRGWPENWVRRQEAIRSKARRTVILGGSRHASGDRRRALRLLHDRNRLIVRDSNVLVAVHVRSRTGGGTAITVQHTGTTGIPVITMDPDTQTVSISKQDRWGSALNPATVPLV